MTLGLQDFAWGGGRVKKQDSEKDAQTPPACKSGRRGK